MTRSRASIMECYGAVVRQLVAALLCIGCGRVAFDPIADAYLPDTYDICEADGVCPLTCIATDTDCQTTCGDGRCVGNTGELCGSCPADCATQQVVCGNAACELGEVPDCYADCGPTPWQWVVREANLIAEVNAVRTAGVTCPGATMKRTAPALVIGTTQMKDAAREWAWEIAHHDFFPLAHNDACNGRTYAERSASGGYTAAVVSRQQTAGQAVYSWKTGADTCPILMSTQYKNAQVGVAVDARYAFVLVLEK